MGCHQECILLYGRLIHNGSIWILKFFSFGITCVSSYSASSLYYIAFSMHILIFLVYSVYFLCFLWTSTYLSIFFNCWLYTWLSRLAVTFHVVSQCMIEHHIKCTALSLSHHVRFRRDKYYQCLPAVIGVCQITSGPRCFYVRIHTWQVFGL